MEVPGEWETQKRRGSSVCFLLCLALDIFIDILYNTRHNKPKGESTYSLGTTNCSRKLTELEEGMVEIVIYS